MNLVVGDYLEVAQGFDAVCLIKDTFKAVTSKFPSILKTVQLSHKTHGDKVFDVGYADEKTRFIYAPLHNMSKVKDTCQELKHLSESMGLERILIPMPQNYSEIQAILDEELDDTFMVITDNPEYIKPVSKESEVPMEKKILECSSRGDKRFSALYARVMYMGKKDTIENHYQNSKRFLNPMSGEYVQCDSPKGKKVDGAVVFDELYEPDILTDFYTYLWIEYFRTNQDLLQYASTFDDFNDMFKGKSINCQADVIRNLVRDYDNTVSSVNYIFELKDNWSKANGMVVEFNPADAVDDSVELPRPTTLIVTGHRPKSLFGYRPCAQYHNLQNKIYKCILRFVNDYGVTRCISGGAQGADQLFFWSANQVRTLNKNLENVVYIPFEGQEMRWGDTGAFSKEEYRTMIQSATSTHMCNDTITCNSPYQQVANALMDRNTQMVEQTDYVIGIYKDDINLITNDVEAKGGTLDCLRKAYKAGKKIVIINPFTLKTSRIGF